MAFGLFRKRTPEATDPKPAPVAPEPAAPAAEIDSTHDILELLELELGSLTRQLERAAHSVSAGTRSTTATLANAPTR